MKFSTLYFEGCSDEHKVGYVGAYERLMSDHHFRRQLKKCKNIGGTSFGALVALGIASDLTSASLFSEMSSKIKKEGNIVSNTVRLLGKFGFYKGENLRTYTERFVLSCTESRDTTFFEFKRRTGISFMVTGTNITKARSVCFDEHKFPDLKIATALRISCGTVGLFEPVVYEGPSAFDADGTVLAEKGDLMLDGTLLGCIPLSYYSTMFANPRLLVLTIEVQKQYKIKNLMDYTQAIVTALRNSHTQRLLTVFSHLETEVVYLSIFINDDDYLSTYDQGRLKVERRIVT